MVYRAAEHRGGETHGLGISVAASPLPASSPKGLLVRRMTLPARLQKMVTDPTGTGEPDTVQAFWYLTSRGFPKRIAEHIVLHAILRAAILDPNDVIAAAADLGYDTAVLMEPQGTV